MFRDPFAIDSIIIRPPSRRQIAASVDLVARTLETVVRQAISPKVVTYVPSARPGPDEVRMLRVAGFARLWSEVRQNFVFLDQRPEVDWDTVLERYLPEVMAAKSQAEYLSVLKRVMALLRDGHSGIMASDDRDIPAVRIESIEGKPVVTAVLRRRKWRPSGVRPGMEVVEVDGRPAATVIEDEKQYVPLRRRKTAMRGRFRWCLRAVRARLRRCGSAVSMVSCVRRDWCATSRACAGLLRGHNGRRWSSA